MKNISEYEILNLMSLVLKKEDYKLYKLTKDKIIEKFGDDYYNIMNKKIHLFHTFLYEVKNKDIFIELINDFKDSIFISKKEVEEKKEQINYIYLNTFITSFEEFNYLDLYKIKYFNKIGVIDNMLDMIKDNIVDNTLTITDFIDMQEAKLVILNNYDKYKKIINDSSYYHNFNIHSINKYASENLYNKYKNYVTEDMYLEGLKYILSRNNNGIILPKIDFINNLVKKNETVKNALFDEERINYVKSKIVSVLNKEDKLQELKNKLMNLFQSDIKLFIEKLLNISDKIYKYDILIESSSYIKFVYSVIKENDIDINTLKVKDDIKSLLEKEMFLYSLDNNEVKKINKL